MHKGLADKHEADANTLKMSREELEERVRYLEQ
jgi:hypothetical protein